MEAVYDFSKIQPAIVLTSDWILSRITDAQIFFHYHGRFRLNVSCKSTLRVDNHPSVTFFVGHNGKIVYYDFKEGKGLDCFAYVQRVFNLDFNRALQRIASDFGLISSKTVENARRIEYALKEGANIDRECRKETLIQYTAKKWDKESLDFWRLYEITQEELETEQIFPIDRLFLNKQEIFNPTNTPRYAKLENYTLDSSEPDVTRDAVKIYSPYDPNMKWLSSIPIHIPFGLDTLNYESNVVFITKSFKDMIVLKKLFDSVIATQNESEAALSDMTVDMMDRMFDKKIIVFDNDETGVTNCKKFNDRGFGYFNIPKEYLLKYGVKDPSDYVKYYGINALADLFKEKNLL